MKKTVIITAVLILISTALSAKNTRVIIKTNMGKIEVELFNSKAPVTVKNFLRYVDGKKYDKTIFHRVISNFMIQGGGFTRNMKQKKNYAPIKNEAYNRLSNRRGTLAMARTSAVNSATNQFFINVKDNFFLDFKNPSPTGFGYCVFGKVVKGMNVVEKIRNVKTGNAAYFKNVPLKTVMIKSIRRK